MQKLNWKPYAISFGYGLLILLLTNFAVSVLVFIALLLSPLLAFVVSYIVNKNIKHIPYANSAFYYVTVLSFVGSLFILDGITSGRAIVLLYYTLSMMVLLFLDVKSGKIPEKRMKVTAKIALQIMLISVNFFTIIILLALGIGS